MKSLIELTLKHALDKLGFAEHLSNRPLQIDRTKNRQHGDFASNVALILAKSVGNNPREIAQNVVNALDLPSDITKVEIAGPGFINFFVASSAQQSVIKIILDAGDDYGRATVGQGKKVHMEYVSANPTGPLHVGHGRSAAYGSALANLLDFAGFNVHREYYVNDAGRQMDILAASVWLRYLDLCGEKFKFPKNGYQGTYVIDIAKDMLTQHGKDFHASAEEVFKSVPEDESDNGGDKEAHIDGIIANVKNLLGDKFEAVHAKGLNDVLGDIKQDLSEFRVSYDKWFSEKSLQTSGTIQAALARLQKDNHLYKRAGATWFRSTDFGDDKDRVIVRDNGQTTYFASDAAYILNKADRGFDNIICILGADHHGYVPRLCALLMAYGMTDESFTVPLVQFAILYRDGEKLQMSTRSGEFVTLRELRNEVGTDAARYFYVMRKPEQHLDFDLTLAKSESSDNPVYYIQYAHARICSVFRQLTEKGLQYDDAQGLQHVSVLHSQHETDLLTLVAKFPELITHAAQKYEPHQIAHYLRDLANAFHSYYNMQKFITDDATERNARLTLLLVVKQVIVNALTILGISAPEKM